MPNVARVKTWTNFEDLTVADLNAEFDAILAGINDNALDADNLDSTDDYTFASATVTNQVTAGTHVGINTTTFDGTADGTLTIKNGTEPGAVVTDSIQVYAKNSTQGTMLSTLGLYLEEPPASIGSFTATHKIPVWINGTEYHIQLDAV